LSSNAMINNDQIDAVIQEDLIKILGYIASISFLLIVIFTSVYIIFPNVTNDFKGIELDYPYVDIINSILMFAVGSVSNLFTYIFLVAVGISAFFGAQYMEDRLPVKSEEEEHKPRDNKEKPAQRIEILGREVIKKKRAPESIMEKLPEKAKENKPEKPIEMADVDEEQEKPPKVCSLVEEKKIATKKPEETEEKAPQITPIVEEKPPEIQEEIFAGSKSGKEGGPTINVKDEVARKKVEIPVFTVDSKVKPGDGKKKEKAKKEITPEKLEQSLRRVSGLNKTPDE